MASVEIKVLLSYEKKWSDLRKEKLEVRFKKVRSKD
jgi:hypothetical protein